ncbi:MAG: DUF6364 family protein [Desulfuromonadales bacterium]
MQAKLTLSIDRNIIEDAKEYSRQQRKSLSKMVENYLRLIARKETPKDELTPIVASLVGSLPMHVHDKGREEIAAYLTEKHK